MRVLVLGAGFGGLEITSRLSAEFGDELDLTLVDKVHPYADIARPGVRFLPKAGVFAEGRAAVVADAIAARLRGEKALFGSSRVARWFGQPGSA